MQTAIVSDLHLCEAQGPDKRSAYWKRYKSREFFFDEDFKVFLDILMEKSKGPSELILNGDIFDFDSCMVLPEDPPYEVSWLEKLRGLHPQEPKSSFKVRAILKDHQVWTQALSNYVKKGNTIIFVIGNHDLELHYPLVQKDIIAALELTTEEAERVRFCAWFYISNQDTLIEHGNQYDPYCLAQGPITPLIQKFHRVEVRVPFGNLATRYMINGMGFFNPHVDSNYIMSAKEYVRFFLKYVWKAQPLLIWTWFWGAGMTLFQAFVDLLKPSLKDPLTIEDRIEDIAKKANATPRMVRELRELSVHPAAFNPILIARELWLDRAILVMFLFFILFQLFAYINLVYHLSFFWMLIPLAFFIPFFIFYSKAFQSKVHKYKEPDERILAVSAKITRVKRVVYGHTHIYRHEHIGSVEHLNSGTWSPAFLDVECTKPFGRKTFVLIEPTEGSTERSAGVYQFESGKFLPLHGRKRSVERELEEAVKQYK
jgi:UDP-2,3-diacylglucosamine pyrophosphatase LpxH